MNDHKVVLITGGCGAIGSCVVNYLKKLYTSTRFVNVDAITYCARKENIEEPYDNYILYEGDICNVDFIRYIFKQEKPSLVIHLAAETHVDQSFGNSFRFTQTNIMGTHTLLECIRHIGGVKLFIHMSTDEVYGSVNDGEICTEKSMFAPSNPYSATKAAADLLIRAYEVTHGYKSVTIRPSNNFGPGQHSEKFIPTIIRSIKNGEGIPVYGDGMQEREWTSVRETARAVEFLLRNLNNYAGQTFNLSSGKSMTNLKIIEEIVSIVRPQDDYLKHVRWVTDRPGHDRKYWISSSKILSLGFEFNEGFKETLLDVCDSV